MEIRFTENSIPSEEFYINLPDPEEMVKAAEEALERPSDSYWSDPEMWKTHTLMFSTPDISQTDDYLVEYSNYRSILEDLEGTYPDDIEGATFGHWTYSKFVAIRVRVITDSGEITPAFSHLYSIALDLRDHYPLYSEEDHSDLEMDVWDKAIKDAIDWVDEDEKPEERYLSDWVTDVTTHLYQNERVIGYHDVGYIPEEEMQAAIDFANSRIGKNVSVPETPLF